MSDQTKVITVKDVEIRSWPQRADVVVIDVNGARVVAHYPLNDPRPYVIWDPKAPYAERAAYALELLEDEQEYLRACFGSDAGEFVKLKPTPVVRERIAELLGEYDLTLDEIAFTLLRPALRKLAGMEIERVHALMCDWFDAVERHYPAGSARQDADSWVHRAAPDRACHHLYLACGVEDRAQATPEQMQAAYALFRELIDQEITHFTFGHALRWLYYHRTEFAGVSPFELRAFADADRLPGA